MNGRKTPSNFLLFKVGIGLKLVKPINPVRYDKQNAKR